MRLLSTAFLLITSQSAAVAQSFTGKDFLSWPGDSQRAYISNSVIMIGIVATKVKPEISSCVDEWFSASDAVTAQRQGYISDVIASYPDYHPQATILAIIEKQCGKFERL